MWAPKHEVCGRDPITYLGGGSVNGTRTYLGGRYTTPFNEKGKTENLWVEEFKLN
jgi:hypothetical protein